MPHELGPASHQQSIEILRCWREALVLDPDETYSGPDAGVARAFRLAGNPADWALLLIPIMPASRGADRVRRTRCLCRAGEKPVHSGPNVEMNTNKILLVSWYIQSPLACAPTVKLATEHRFAGPGPVGAR